MSSVTSFLSSSSSSSTINNTKSGISLPIQSTTPSIIDTDSLENHHHHHHHHQHHLAVNDRFGGSGDRRAGDITHQIKKKSTILTNSPKRGNYSIQTEEECWISGSELRTDNSSSSDSEDDENSTMLFRGGAGIGCDGDDIKKKKTLSFLSKSSLITGKYLPIPLDNGCKFNRNKEKSSGFIHSGGKGRNIFTTEDNTFFDSKESKLSPSSDTKFEWRPKRGTITLPSLVL